MANCLSTLIRLRVNATAWQQRGCAINSGVAFSRKSRHFAPFLAHFTPILLAIGFESGRGHLLSATQRRRVPTFALVTTAEPPTASVSGQDNRSGFGECCATLLILDGGIASQIVIKLGARQKRVVSAAWTPAELGFSKRRKTNGRS